MDFKHREQHHIQMLLESSLWLEREVQCRKWYGVGLAELARARPSRTPFCQAKIVKATESQGFSVTVS